MDDLKGCYFREVLKYTCKEMDDKAVTTWTCYDVSVPSFDGPKQIESTATGTGSIVGKLTHIPYAVPD
jgi:hypothetical protein